MIPITQLNGWENLPVEVETLDIDSVYQCGKMDGHNQAVSLLEQVNLRVDENKLANILEESGGIIDYKTISKRISKSIKQWAYLEVKR